MIKAVLFDFNGVLLQDRKWHEEAWNELSKSLRGKELNKEDFEQYVHGRIPKDTFGFLLDHSPSSEELKKYTEQKEGLYQRIALNNGDELKLSPGAIELFEILDENNIKKTIATSAPLINFKFYYKYLGLKKWFPFQDIVFDDGTFLGKPAPDIYLKAAKKINVNIKIA